jgi:hypothetical protein
MEKIHMSSTIRPTHRLAKYNDKNQIFFIYIEIKNGAVAKSYMTNDLLIYG